MFAQPTLRAIESAPIDNPGTTKRPGLPGVTYIGIPGFPDVANTVRKSDRTPNTSA